ncbi:MAG: hypothetical protein ACI9UA_005700 [Pseudoalteromonas tetraodonis]|jgi:hypothetical protein
MMTERPTDSRSTELHSVGCRTYTKIALAAITLTLPACEAFKVDIGTEDSIKLDPIKIELDPIDVNMRVDVYQYTGTSEEKKEAVKKVGDAAENQRNRMAEVQILKDSRWVGEDHEGLLHIIDLPAGKDGEWVQRTVDAENGDRYFLMMDKSNSTGEALGAIRLQQWQIRTQAAYPGEWIEVPGGVEGTFRWAAAEKKKQDD